jgi:hypothetical protein
MRRDSERHGPRQGDQRYDHAVLLFDAPLTLREYVTHEEVPLATIFREVFTFIAGRDDVVVFGAHAVNAYVEPERMTQDIDLLSLRARDLSEEIREHLGRKLTIAVRVREVLQNTGFRVYQLRSPKNRHLVDLRQTDALPESREIERVKIVAPASLLAMKVVSAAHRRGAEKGLSDRLDAHRLLNAFPELRAETGQVADRIAALAKEPAVADLWRELVHERLEGEADDE